MQNRTAYISKDPGECLKRTMGERNNTRYIIKTVTSGGGHVMVWAWNKIAGTWKLVKVDENVSKKTLLVCHRLIFSQTPKMEIFFFSEWKCSMSHITSNKIVYCGWRCSVFGKLASAKSWTQHNWNVGVGTSETIAPTKKENTQSPRRMGNIPDDKTWKMVCSMQRQNDVIIRAKSSNIKTTNSIFWRFVFPIRKKIVFFAKQHFNLRSDRWNFSLVAWYICMAFSISLWLRFSVIHRSSLKKM